MKVSFPKLVVLSESLNFYVAWLPHSFSLTVIGFCGSLRLKVPRYEAAMPHVRNWYSAITGLGCWHENC